MLIDGIEPILEQTVKAVIAGKTKKPENDKVIQALLKAEKEQKKVKKPLLFAQLVGTWRLCFASGTQKAKNRGGIVLGKGRYFGQWLQIYLSYDPKPILSSLSPVSGLEYGQMINTVKIAALTLTVKGPAKLLTQQGILAFDFTHLTVKIGELTVYSREIRGGNLAEQQFYQDKVNKQAFFTFFILRNQWIAARGRGGGLAIWGKVE